MIQRIKVLRWSLTGRSGRRKKIFVKALFHVPAYVLPITIISTLSLSLYFPLSLHRNESESISWQLKPWQFLKNYVPKALNNYAFML